MGEFGTPQAPSRTPLRMIGTTPSRGGVRWSARSAISPLARPNAAETTAFPGWHDGLLDLSALPLSRGTDGSNPFPSASVSFSQSVPGCRRIIAVFAPSVREPRGPPGPGRQPVDGPTGSRPLPGVGNSDECVALQLPKPLVGTVTAARHGNTCRATTRRQRKPP
jgi:hypothetical protein